ncbi:MAG: hypothetical protein P8L44_04995 [Opitutales bacterium]|jgi:hypothetical protein|nr:hypothetical protein [Opitutales bacterium]
MQDDVSSVFQIKYIRQKNSGLTYTPMYSSDLNTLNFITFPGSESITPIDNNYELVCVEAPVSKKSSASYFGKVRVDY